VAALLDEPRTPPSGPNGADAAAEAVLGWLE
jgi:hypothetical protein